ncbi:MULTISPECIES: precorrin-6Y C5,15-methyltransferase (decarboxylating) subunit CbiT [unclassified Streptomyces]|uniref:precorrin-6Y C5,15-methyltransferase (decarboxylating) subunit CbiT n=1 Tax=unclassified Streptomyces TaxID=2593676 RepID=UPI00088E2B15|nr:MULTISPECIES: precorrin-6Y C5,15-methyltransferase (decarboxylating) subunit CbiT [unclassified Streptomyces]PBC83545.1 precorrin-6Y C5,15-methyltransferase (decarboxylating) [Streptomyces sp. 2321.6]SDR41303.1 precorrin-6Y C5,15-methyltransferase (decarboxylating) [Streptomyces sp. KS_16]SED00138.1 precorrin-6Y C5,15-methyltransferase (decarboxylating) [Streptomyces sp. 2133.1]SNC69623.1 precorrin-6Y C5,15-methyltransferase (decarboxylating) [Streptomyces sp. 2114.4]
MSPAPPAPAAPEPVSVVGIGADGWDGLPAASRQALQRAEVLIGGPRQLALLPGECAGERVPWPSPLRPAVPGLLATHAGRRVCVLASGDPMFYGIGRTLTEVLAETASEAEAEGAPGREGEAAAAAATSPKPQQTQQTQQTQQPQSPHPPRLRIFPHPSSVSYACARLGWPLEDTEVITLVGRPAENLARGLYDGHRLLVLSAGAGTPAEVAALLRAHGFGPTRMRVLEQLGGPRERTAEGTADGWEAPPADPLNVIALDCRRAPGTPPLSTVPGLPDAAYEHDGQLTKRHVRAATLAALAPAPGELLWDIGGGSGSIAIEWLRAHRTCRAIGVERDAVRAERIGRNARSLGVPALRVVHGSAPAALEGLPTPDAVFIGGGLTAPGLLAACWEALPAGGRIVANTVTLESEAQLADCHRRYGGELVRLAVAHAVPVGGFTGWRQAMPVTQWSAVKPRPAVQPPAAFPATSPSPSSRPQETEQP